MKYILLFIIFILFSCSDSPTESKDEPSKDEIFPLSIGNEWVYVDSIPTSLGWQIDSSKISIVDSSTIYFDGDSIKTFHMFDGFNYSWRYSKSWLVANDSAGFSYYGTNYWIRDNVIGKSLIYKYPVMAGESWQALIFFAGFSSVPSDVICLSTNEKFNTPLGDMECHLYRYPVIDMDSYSFEYVYVKKGLGIVGYIRKSVDGISHRKGTLKSFVVN